MLRRLYRQLSLKLRRAEAAGVDKAGNAYFRQLRSTEGNEEGRERRWVQFNGGADVTTLPVEWRSWLAGTRTEPPSLEELEDAEKFRKEVKMKAALLDKEEEKRRFRAKSLELRLATEDVRPVNVNNASDEASPMELRTDKLGKEQSHGHVNGDEVRVTPGESKLETTSKEAPPKPASWQPSDPPRPKEVPKRKESFQPSMWQPPKDPRR